MIPEHPLGLQTWLALARRLEQIRLAREDEAEPVPELVFDIYDQATLK